MIWSIKYKGETKSLPDWGIKKVRLQLVNQDVDTLTFLQPCESILSEPIFEEGEIIELSRDKVRWFYGRVEDAAFVAEAGTSGYQHTVSGPWWWLSTMGFRQKWNARTVAGGATAPQFTSSALLGAKADGTLQTIAEQIAEAVNYAIEQDAPLAFDGTGLPTNVPPLRDVWNAPVSEVIRRMIEWCPDVVTWFDYSTTPFPTLRMRRREDQPIAEIDWETVRPTLQIRPRNDLKVPGVIIYYLRTDSVNGNFYTIITEDKAGPEGFTGREPKALLAAISLEGTQAAFAQAAVVCDPIFASEPEWWRLRDPQLADCKNLKIKSPTFLWNGVPLNGAGEPIPQTDPPFPREFKGQYAPWMGGDLISVTVKALASYTEGQNYAVADKPVYFTFQCTNLVTNTYNSSPGGTPGEATPTGLAETLLSAANVTHFDGQLIISEQVASGIVKLGDCLNIIGGREEWETMRAQVQSVLLQIDDGKTQVTFGPPRHLGPSDYIELLRATRNRIRIVAPGSVSTGQASCNSAVLGEKFTEKTLGKGQGSVTKQVWEDPTGETKGSITFDAASFNGKAIAPTEQAVCIVGPDGNPQDGWFAMVIMSAPYRK